jgi:spore maturation protein CgeB
MTTIERSTGAVTTPSLRILLILPLYGGSLPVGRYCGMALSEMGHTVEVFEAPEYNGAFNALKGLRVGTDRLEHLENGFLQLLSQAILAKVEQFEPDLVLALAQAPLTRQALRRLAKDKVVTAMWFVEDYRLFTYWRAFASYYDIFAVIQKDPFLEELGRIGQRNPLYLPLAAHPSFHRPLELNPVESRMYGSDLSFLGAGYPNRRTAFQHYLSYDFKIWGSDWDGDVVLQPLVQKNGTRIESDDAVKIFNAAKINLNLHSSIKGGGEIAKGDFVNPRTFEIACCGGFQLVDQRSLMPELFTGEELALFSSLGEMQEKIDHYLSRPEERARYAQKGRERVLKEHTYAARMHTLIEHIAAVVPEWPRVRRSAPAGADLPPELAREVEALMEKLKIPLSTSFPDLVWAVRQRQNELTPLETAILFLDEWKKQYDR